MPVTPVQPVALSPVRPQDGTPAGSAALARPRKKAQDVGAIGKQAQDGTGKAVETAPAAPQVYGRFKIGDPGLLAFGPDQNASALNRIPGDGFAAPVNGVDLGHQPTRGLNILA